jgi:hexosaminidase
LNTQDRLLIGWNEILNEKLIDTAICQYWTHNFDKVLEHIKNGRKTIMSEMSCLYLNYPSKTTTMEKVYTYNPIPDQLEKKNHNLILGLEACVWSEYIPNIERLEYQAFPRLAAVAEIGWTSKEQKNFDSFMQRITNFNQRLDTLKINYDKGS